MNIEKLVPVSAKGKDQKKDDFCVMTPDDYNEEPVTISDCNGVTVHGLTRFQGLKVRAMVNNAIQNG